MRVQGWEDCAFGEAKEGEERRNGLAGCGDGPDGWVGGHMQNDSHCGNLSIAYLWLREAYRT